MGRDNVIRLGSLIAFAALCFGYDYAARALFGASYIGWYLAAGSLMALVVTVLGIVNGDIDRDPDLISSHPLLFFAAYCYLFAALCMTLSEQNLNRHARATDSIFDTLVSIVFAMLVIVASVAWLLFVVPAQYFVVLIAGAPARNALASTARVYMVEKPGVNGIMQRDFELRTADQPAPEPHFYEPTLRRKPVTLTSALSGLMLAGINQWIA